MHVRYTSLSRFFLPTTVLVWYTIVKSSTAVPTSHGVDDECMMNDGDTSSNTCTNRHQKQDHTSVLTRLLEERTQPLLPSMLPPPQIFESWDPPMNSTIDLPSKTKQIVARGSIIQQHDETKLGDYGGTTALPPKSRFAVLPEAVPRETVRDVLSLLKFGEVVPEETKGFHDGRTAVTLDTDPDTVDGMSTQEIFLDNDSLRSGSSSKFGNSIEDEPDWQKRTVLRRQIREILDPYLDGVLTPFVRENHPEVCDSAEKAEGRECTPCYSLIRRYRSRERVSHAPHYDRHSLVTVVVSLSDYGREYVGGLYVSTKSSRRYYLGLKRGDAVVHKSDLHHGVQILDTHDDDDDDGNKPPERWSWILWYRDSNFCHDHSNEWHKSCAADGNPTCQALQANKGEGGYEAVLRGNKQACDNGHAGSCVKLSRAYLKTLPSPLEKDEGKARKLLERSVELADDPDGYYGLALLTLIEAFGEGSRPISDSVPPPKKTWVRQDRPALLQAVVYLEQAAKGGNPYAMFNLGIAHLYGYALPPGTNDPDVAGEWFEASGIPEGYYARALHAQFKGDIERANRYGQRAMVLGFGTPWRKHAREQTGTGGAGGVDLNLPWPPLAPDGRLPPLW